MATCNPNTLIQAATSFQSLDEDQFQMAVLQLLCDITASGGAAMQVLQGNGNPVDAPANPSFPALYTDLTTGILWTWNVITQAWF